MPIVTELLLLTNAFYFSYLKKDIFLIHISERDLPWFERGVSPSDTQSFLF